MELCSKISQPSKNIKKKKSKKQLLFKIKLRLGDDIIPCFFLKKILPPGCNLFYLPFFMETNILFLVLQVLHVFIFNSSIETP